ncbi:patatin-like phospholipase family protein [Massilia sp. P8910]|uniref:patatin-like phospholipase family protein n=1 Tax=Massilia antarctica TaxID=2765360 RepID=UPI001E5E2613|nr:patatin-like phospholipase family protein [Massilia antarctica]MCE3606746.1 patatin-like phospholipase family protein [Massilia antarctica]
MHALSFHAGPHALAHIRQHGLRARDIAVVPAAAGGPKGLIFQSLDQWLFGDWFPQSPRERALIGASIGAWRMAAACQADPVAALARLGELYCGQRYTAKPSPQEINAVCRKLLHELVGGHEAQVTAHPQHRLHVIAARGRRALAEPAHRRAEATGFAAAALLNLASRASLGRVAERVVVSDARGAPSCMPPRFDSFTTHFATLDSTNLADALLASGTLPMLMPPVRTIAGAPPGAYWDGGLIDYHLALPYSNLAPGEIVLYPHFSEHIVPGWLDKAMPWRRMARGAQRGWLDNVLLVAPTAHFLSTLPRRKLPDRKDFTFYGLDHDERIRNWQQAIGQGQRLRDEFTAFVDQPDLSRIQTF